MEPKGRRSLSFPKRRRCQSAQINLQYVPPMKSRITLALISFISALICSPSVRSDDSKQGQAEQLIRGHFQEHSIRHRGGSVVFEICFDLCDVFQWTGSPHSEDAWDFVALYEYKQGVGKESKEFISKAKASVQAAAKRMSAYCRDDSADSEAPFDCSWPQLAKSKGIRVGTSTYDEGERCFGWRDLSSDARPTRPHCRPVKELPWKSKSGRIK